MKSFAIFSIISLAAATALPVTDEQWYTVEKVELPAARFAELDALHNQTLSARQGSCSWQAFSGNTCNQPAGAITDVPSGGRCNDARNRHSFFISSGCPTLRVSIQENVNCPGGNNGGTYGPGCYNVNTGRNWQSSFVARA